MSVLWKAHVDLCREYVGRLDCTQIRYLKRSTRSSVVSIHERANPDARELKAYRSLGDAVLGALVEAVARARPARLSLRSNRLSSCALLTLADALLPARSARALSRLVELDLSENALGGESHARAALQQLASNASLCESLRKLSLVNCQLKPTASRALFETWAVSTSPSALRVLDLSRNTLDNSAAVRGLGAHTPQLSNLSNFYARCFESG